MESTKEGPKWGKEQNRMFEAAHMDMDTAMSHVHPPCQGEHPAARLEQVKFGTAGDTGDMDQMVKTEDILGLGQP